MTTRLVAGREIREALRSKALAASTVLLALAIVAAIVVPQVVGGDDAPHRVGLIGSPPAVTPDTVLAAGRLAGVPVEVREVGDELAAEKELRAGDLHMVVSPGPTLVVEEQPDEDSELSAVGSALSRLAGLQSRLANAGLPPGTAVAALDAPPLAVRALERPEVEDDGSRGVAFLGTLLLYLLLLTYGSWILNSVAEEKSSRVVEVLLAAVRPGQLLAGKVLGVGAVALGQALLLAAVALIAASAVGFDELPTGTVGVIATTILWFLLGFAFYSCAYATAASLTSRQEDAQMASGPLTAVLIFAYVAGGIPATSSPDAAFVRLLSYLPPTAPVVMPARDAAASLAAWEVPLAATLVVVGTVGMARLAAHIYPRVALHSGARLKLREALRAPVA